MIRRLSIAQIIDYVRRHMDPPGHRKPSEPHIIFDCIIAADGTWIECLHCKAKSYNRNDVQAVYCGNCHAFLRHPQTEPVASPPVPALTFTQDEVESLNGYQACGGYHPFTCGYRHEGDSALVATVNGWTCRHCDYTQDWAHPFMKNWEWRHVLRHHARQKGRTDGTVSGEAKQ